MWDYECPYQCSDIGKRCECGLIVTRYQDGRNGTCKCSRGPRRIRCPNQDLHNQKLLESNEKK